MRVLAASVRAWRSYRGAGRRTRAFLAARLVVLPLKPLASEFERLHGRVLGVGSGHGVAARFVAEPNPDVTAFDAAAAVDLMHHVPTADRRALADALARAVKPGGTLLIKDIARTPRWKHAVNRLHDRIISGDATTGSDPAALAELFEQAGFTVERLDRIARFSPYPHFILRARRARPNP